LSRLRIFDVVIPDVLAAELLDPPKSLFVNAGWTLTTFSTDEVEQVYALTAKYKAPSVPDLFTLLTARRDGIILLTGDKALRRAARIEGVRVHGFLWLLDMLLHHGEVPPKKAAHCFAEGVG
jgi:rRNA-processing protein FCF1